MHFCSWVPSPRQVISLVSNDEPPGGQSDHKGWTRYRERERERERERSVEGKRDKRREPFSIWRVLATSAMFDGAMQSSPPPPPDPPPPCVSRASCLSCGVVEVLFRRARISASADKNGWAVVVLAVSLIHVPLTKTTGPWLEFGAVNALVMSPRRVVLFKRRACVRA